MDVATSKTQVGVRELKNNLSRYLARVQAGEEVIVTDHGNPIARLVTVTAETDRLASLIASGAVTAPRSTTRRRPKRRIAPSSSVGDLVADQRR